MSVPARAVAGASARPAHDRPDLWRELVLGLSVFAVYLAVNAWPAADRPGRAVEHGQAVLDLERALQLDVELRMNQWLAGANQLRMLANHEYAFTYVITAFALLFWVYAYRPAIYRPARMAFVLLNLFAIGCFAAYPVAPPRLLPDTPFVDTVALGHTWGSWGTPLIDASNQFAAMPSLHIGWAVWVSAVLARLAAPWFAQLLGIGHVLLTLVVIVATGNHYWMDGAAALVPVGVAMWLAGLFRLSGQRVPAPDAFFLHVESATAPQTVGGLVLLDVSDRPLTRDDVLEVLRSRLDDVPRLRQRLAPGSWWRRPRWVPGGELDDDWHVPVYDVSTPAGGAGMAGAQAVVGELAGTPLPRDRPLWRIALITGVGGDRAALVTLLHHCVADGIGTVTLMLRLLDPPRGLLGNPVAAGPLRRAGGVLATVTGLAELATDSRAEPGLPPGGTGNVYGTLQLPLAQVRELARTRRVRVIDLLLTALAEAICRTATGPLPGRLAVSVPLAAARPSGTPEGNHTSGVIVPIPLDPMPEHVRLAAISAATRQLLGRPTRAIAARFVMSTFGNLMPPGLHAHFARAVYRSRYFHAIVTNMPGADGPTSFADATVRVAFPIVPPAPGSPLAVGALGWDDTFAVGVTAHPTLINDLDAFLACVRLAFTELGQPAER